jgi:hypothetical protein
MRQPLLMSKVLDLLNKSHGEVCKPSTDECTVRRELHPNVKLARQGRNDPCQSPRYAAQGAQRL